MQEKPKVTVSRGRRTDSAAKEFTFTQADVSAAGNGLASFRASAWDSFKSFPSPSPLTRPGAAPTCAYFPRLISTFPKKVLSKTCPLSLIICSSH